MKFVFDECISYRIPNALKVLGKDAAPYSDHWAKGAPDTQWIPAASRAEWCIVTSDCLKRPHERAALREERGRVIVLATQNLSFWDQVKLVIKRWEDIEKVVRKKKPPYILRFTARSRQPQQLSV